MAVIEFKMATLTSARNFCAFSLFLQLLLAPHSAAYHGGEYSLEGSDAGDVAPFPDDDIRRLLQVHNEGRAEVDPSASNMNRVTWSHELYAAAKERVETCQYFIDIPVETGHFGKVVQFTGISRRPSFDLVDAVDQWLYLGKDSYDYNDDSCSRNPVFCRMYKLFTWATMEEMGCAEVLCGELNNTYSNKILPNTYYWKCNYYPVGNLDDANPYTTGTPCTDCADESGWCNSEYDMCDSECTSSDDECDCLYSDTCTDVYDYDPEACTCTCNHAVCADDPFVCILKCGDPSWTVVEERSGVCECDCPEGYEANAAKDVCNDVDECLDPGRCAHFCDNTEGSYVCSCMHGFELDDDDRSCVPFFQIGRHDFDLIQFTTAERALTTLPTTPTTPGVVTTEEIFPTTVWYTTPFVPTTVCPVFSCGIYGTYDSVDCSCDCDAGYEFDEGLGSCRDTDECATTETGCETCQNLPGSFRCTACPAGSELNSDTERCDTDACKLGEAMFCNGKGFLDEQNCRCVCYPGYKGASCQRTCNAKDTRCWPTYEPEPPTDASQCNVFCPECECDGYQPCNNTGTLAKAPGFQHIKNGVCFCYCPAPWSGAVCDECNLQCQNGGAFDEEACSCACPPGWFGVDCTRPCVEKSRLCTNRTTSLCGEVAIIDDHCPIMCSICQPIA